MYRSLSRLGLVAFLCLAGCRASPAPDSGFLQNAQLLKSDKDVPFNRIWVNKNYSDKEYSQLYVAPVNTDFVMKENIWEMASFANLNPQYVKQNVQLLADYQRNAIIQAAAKDPDHKFKIVDKPGPDTLILQLAIVQIVPSKPLLQAASYYTWISTIVMIGGSVATQSEDQGKGVIAMEGRTRDGATGEITSMFADREHPPAAIIDVKALFWWEPAKPICDGWARQIIAVENHRKGSQIEPIPNFQWVVW